MSAKTASFSNLRILGLKLRNLHIWAAEILFTFFIFRAGDVYRLRNVAFQLFTLEARAKLPYSRRANSHAGETQGD